MMETPILNAITRPWLVNCRDFEGVRTLHEYAQAMLADRVTILYAQPLLDCDVGLGATPESDLVNVFLPVRRAWFEVAMGSGVTFGFQLDAMPASTYCEMLLNSDVVNGSTRKEEWGGSWLERAGNQGIPDCGEKCSSDLRDRLCTRIRVWTTTPSGGVCPPTTSTYICADPARHFGRLMSHNGDIPFILERDQPADDPTNGDTDSMGRRAGIAALVMAYWNIRGVEAVAEGWTNQHVGKRTRQAERLPWIRTHTLKVNQKGRMVPLCDPGGSGSRALHMVKGHFSRCDGRDGRGLLFGKHACVCWKPPHTRGNAENGVIQTDYDLDPGV